jgi:hypothetical protein
MLNNTFIVYAIIIFAIATRFVPHLANAAPITAIAIFAAVYLPKKYAIGVPLVVRFISDIFLGFFQLPLMIAVYASHGVGVLLGLWIKRSLNQPVSKWVKIVGSGVASTVIFFLVTNFAFFYSEYTHNIPGIIEAYTNGLPFLRGTLVGDVGYTVALFGVYELVQAIIKRKQTLLAHNQ